MLRVPSSTRVVEIPELAPVPDFHRAAVAAFVLADAHAFRIVAIGAEGRGAGRADPFRAALVAALLLLPAAASASPSAFRSRRAPRPASSPRRSDAFRRAAAAIPRGCRRRRSALSPASASTPLKTCAKTWSKRSIWRSSFTNCRIRLDDNNVLLRRLTADRRTPNGAADTCRRRRDRCCRADLRRSNREKLGRGALLGQDQLPGLIEGAAGLTAGALRWSSSAKASRTASR